MEESWREIQVEVVRWRRAGGRYRWREIQVEKSWREIQVEVVRWRRAGGRYPREGL